MRNSLNLVLHYLPEFATTINKNGLKGYKPSALTDEDKELIPKAKRMMNYKGKNDIDTINHMCDFLYNVEKSGKTGFIIESLIDQGSIRTLDEAYDQAKGMNKIAKLNKEMHNIGLAHVYLTLKGYRYGYSIVRPDIIDLRPLTVGYMKNTLYTFIQMMKYIAPDSEDPTDADDIISDLAYNQVE